MRSDLERERVVGFRPFAALRGLLQPAWDSCLSSFWVGRPGSPLDVAMGLHVGLLFFRSTFNAVRPRRLSTSRFHSARPARKKKILSCPLRLAATSLEARRFLSVTNWHAKMT
jgi:hypothetical protein